jgi:7,8-dihydropterin-6-yl-methyl-4-(beta-D-ribofuranosyl)aminobenzene 5'-phosphate synthase
MKLTVVMDNHTYIDQYYLAEPAVCYYIEDEDKKILFDLAYSRAYIENAEKLNIDLNKVDTLVFSHGHNDHTLGYKYFDAEFADKQKVIAHPLCFNKKRYDDGQDIGSPFTLDYLKDRYDIELSEKPINITKNLIFLGQIPITNSFEERRSIGEVKINNEWIEDKIIEDSAMVYKTANGIFVITGCSHAGICNIINYAKEVSGDDRVIGVLGGFHLFEKDNRTLETVKFLKEQNIKMLYPAHCISLKVKALLVNNLNITEVGVGLELEI